MAPKREVQAARAGAWAGVGSGRREISMGVFVVVVFLSSSRIVCVLGSGGGGVVGNFFVVAVDEIDVGGGWLCVVVDIF